METIGELSEPQLILLPQGWAALGPFWAVHAPTQEEVIAKYQERATFYQDLVRKYDAHEKPDRSGDLEK